MGKAELGTTPENEVNWYGMRSTAHELRVTQEKL